MAQPKLSWEPLAVMLGGGTDKEMAYVIGRSGRQIARWRNQGGLQLHVAEALCDEMRWHPTEVWGMEYWEKVLSMPEGRDKPAKQIVAPKMPVDDWDAMDQWLANAC